MIVIFSGYNQRAVIAFLRTLVRNKIDNFTIIASGKRDTILLSEYRNKVSYIRENKDFLFSEINDILNRLSNLSKMLWIAPTTEYINRFFLNNRLHFEKMGCVIPLVDEKKYSLVSNKESFYELCLKEKIDVPKKMDFTEKFEKPMIAKPICYGDKLADIFSPVFIRNEWEYDEFTQKYKIEKFFFQEFLESGESEYLLFYFDKNGGHHVFSQRNLAQQFGGKSIIAAISDDVYKNGLIVDPYIKLFNKIDFWGLVMVEIRLVDNKAYMIEANPRFWGPSQLFCDAGANFFELLLKDYNLIKKDVSWKKLISSFYFWSGGIDRYVIDAGCVFHGEGKTLIHSEFDKFKENDIYMKNDTNKIYAVEKLKQLYMRSSKHSNYQILPSALETIIGRDEVVTKSRQENERLDYILTKIDIKGKHLLDIGGNTGFFTFEAIDYGAEHIDYYEGNGEHAEFVKIASEILEMKNKVDVFNEYFLFDNKTPYDVVFNLNVIHHLGDDFFDVKDIEKAKRLMLDCINSLAKTNKQMVFQMGFNWKGNRDICLFDHGTKEEMIEFIKSGTKDYWNIENIGVAEKKDNVVVYKDLDENNILRNDSLGEFLNRPLFILKSKFK